MEYMEFKYVWYLHRRLKTEWICVSLSMQCMHAQTMEVSMSEAVQSNVGIGMKRWAAAVATKTSERASNRANEWTQQQNSGTVATMIFRFVWIFNDFTSIFAIVPHEKESQQHSLNAQCYFAFGFRVKHNFLHMSDALRVWIQRTECEQHQQ